MGQGKKSVPVLGVGAGEKNASEDGADSAKPETAEPPVRHRESDGLFNLLALDELTSSMDKAMASVRKIAEASAQIRPLLDKMAAFETWAMTMPGIERKTLPTQTPGAVNAVSDASLPFSWDPPEGYEAIPDLPAETMQKLIGTSKGQMECVKYGRGASDQVYQEVARIRMESGEVFYYRPEPAGNVQGTFWVRPETAVIIRNMSGPKT